MLQRAWLHRGLLAWALWPLSLLFAALAAVRRACYAMGLKRTVRLPVPVIVVGNVVAGGAGKTPVVIAVVRHLQARGLRVGVVSRGYGRRTRDGREVHADSDARDVGDEPLLVHRATGAPVAVDRDRPGAGRRLLAAHPGLQVIVSDDGLQHLALGRDIEIVAFDDRGVGNGWRLPAGPLREAWPRPADLVLNTGDAPRLPGFRATRTLADAALDATGRHVPLHALGDGADLVVLAGIAQPEHFFRMLRDRGITRARFVALPDHYDFDSWQRSVDAASRIVCTEKDAVKLWAVAPDALAVPLVFTPEAAFFAALDAKLSSAR